MRAVVLESKPGSDYADSPDSYEFPRQYLGNFEPLTRGEPMVAIIYEPRGQQKQGRMAYVAWALLDKPPVPVGRTTSTGAALYEVHYAGRHREFDRAVPREAPGEPIEAWLRTKPRGRVRNVATLGLAVRPLTEPDMELIFSLGSPNGVNRALIETDPAHQFAEALTMDERTRRLVNAVQREAAFRDDVLAAYLHRCAVSGLSVGPSPVRASGLLDAAHIRPVANQGVDSVSNGLALTPTLHRLFDKGLFTLTYRGLDLEVRTSPRLAQEMIVGREGFALRLHDGLELTLPTDPALRPAPEQLDYHSSQVFIRH